MAERTLDLLRHPVIRHLFAAQIGALLGTGLATVALALLAYDLAGPEADAVLGTALAIKMIAYVTLAQIASALIRLTTRRARRSARSGSAGIAVRDPELAGLCTDLSATGGTCWHLTTRT